MSRTKFADEVDLLAEEPLAEMILWYGLHRLQERYVTVIDAGRLEEWPDLFTEDGVYEIVPKENVDSGLAVGISCIVLVGR